jgi:hypothetical protein
LPDFFITDKNRKDSILLEVKYRRRWNTSNKQNLAGALQEQVEFWQPLHVAIFLGEPVSPGKHHDDSMRIACLRKHGNDICHRVERKGVKPAETPFSRLEWADLWTFEETFGDMHDIDALAKISGLLRALPELDTDK